MLTWQVESFENLTPLQVHLILQLREAVFQLEQQCLYQDIDKIDYEAIHIMGFENNELIAYARVYNDDGDIHIGRVVVAQTARGRGMGKELINQCLSYINKNNPGKNIIVSAQLYLQKFYEELDFKKVSEPYDEIGILHIKMVSQRAQRAQRK